MTKEEHTDGFSNACFVSKMGLSADSGSMRTPCIFDLKIMDSPDLQNFTERNTVFLS
ncbi:hypothetical protein BVRB_9g216740 [Beta vulgaris subsp. vulgaris]|nr:hypothetical protein BVRB_9g216740 [Beta vulgaris subsp. vulgaris]